MYKENYNNIDNQQIKQRTVTAHSLHLTDCWLI